MKKLLAIMLVLMLALATIPAMAEDNVTVMLDGEVIDCKNAQGVEVPPILVDGTTYLPVRAIANALNLEVTWDDATKSVFINGVSVLAKKTDVINIFINGGKFTAKDANGNVVNPILKDGTTYLPVRAIGEAFDKEVSWDGATRTVTLTSKPEPVIEYTVINKDKTYAFINKETGKALTATDHYTLESEEFTEKASQGFKFNTSPTDGYFFIQSITNGQCFDVSGHSVDAGGEIITWDPTGAENQMFTILDIEGGALVYAKTSALPIEPTDTNTVQNVRTNKPIQLWEIREFNAPVVENAPKTGAYRTFSIGSNTLTDNNGLQVSAKTDNNNQKWRLNEVNTNVYTLTNIATDMSLDVNGQSYDAGGSIITWYTSGDPNQCWILESQGNDTYLIKSVHSNLYLTITGSTLTQEYRDNNKSQVWTMGYTN